MEEDWIIPDGAIGKQNDQIFLFEVPLPYLVVVSPTSVSDLHITLSLNLY